VLGSAEWWHGGGGMVPPSLSKVDAMAFLRGILAAVFYIAAAAVATVGALLRLVGLLIEGLARALYDTGQDIHGGPRFDAEKRP